MKKKTSGRGDAPKPGKRAGNSARKEAPLPPEDLRRTLRDLRVRLIELEIQNDIQVILPKGPYTSIRKNMRGELKKSTRPLPLIRMTPWPMVYADSSICKRKAKIRRRHLRIG